MIYNCKSGSNNCFFYRSAFNLPQLFYMAFPKINLSDYNYILDPKKIAEFPLNKRDHSKLLIYQSGLIKDAHFYDLPERLPDSSLLVFNNTKVIPARMYFRGAFGATIEILLDQPIFPHKDPLLCMSETDSVVWKCIVGNKKKWKEDETLNSILPNGGTLVVKWYKKDENLVIFRWQQKVSFAKLLELIGHMPLPPYIRRENQQSDTENYQTVYAKIAGSAAAPTAGLHFTPEVIAALKKRAIKYDELTLHIGAGTFQTIKYEDVAEHEMHTELMHISKENLQYLINHEGPIIPVGTTAMRSLESLYWFGLNLETEDRDHFSLSKEFSYETHKEIEVKKSLQNIIDWMDRKSISSFSGETSIFIVPGYKFKICSGIITNFHQAGTTLILLIASLIGDDWKKVYEHALNNNYRFLSYGDSSLLIP